MNKKRKRINLKRIKKGGREEKVKDNFLKNEENLK